MAAPMPAYRGSGYAALPQDPELEDLLARAHAEAQQRRFASFELDLRQLDDEEDRPC